MIIEDFPIEKFSTCIFIDMHNNYHSNIAQAIIGFAVSQQEIET